MSHYICEEGATCSVVVFSQESPGRCELCKFHVTNKMFAYVCMCGFVCMSQESKKVSSYIVRYPVLRTAQSALHFTSWQICSIKHHLNFYGKHPSMQQLMYER